MRYVRRVISSAILTFCFTKRMGRLIFRFS